MPSILLLILSLLASVKSLAGEVSTQNKDSRPIHLEAQLGHSGTVSAVAISADRRYLATASQDTTVLLWEVETGRELRRFRVERSEPVTQEWPFNIGQSPEVLSFSNDDKYLVSATSDNKIQLWEVETGRLLHSFEGHTSHVESIAFTQDGNLLISGSSDGTARVWDIKGGRELRRFQLPNHGFGLSVVSSNGKYVAAGDRYLQEKTGWLWDVETGREIRRIPWPSPDHAVLSPSGRYLAARGFRLGFRLLDLETGHELRNFGDKGLPSSFSNDDKYLVTIVPGGLTSIWETATGREVRNFTTHSYVAAVTFSREGRYLATGSFDKTASLWDVDSGRELRRFEGHAQVMKSVGFGGSGNYVSTTNGMIARLWSVEGREPRLIEALPGFKFTVFSRNNKYLAAQNERTVQLWDLVSVSELRRFDVHPGMMRAAAFSQDARYLVSYGIDQKVRLWDLEAGRELYSLEFKPEYSEAIPVVPTANGKQLIAISANVARFLEVGTGKELRRFEMHSLTADSIAAMTSCVGSADGRHLVTGSTDGAVRLWEVESGREERQFSASSDPIPRDAVLSIALSPDMKYLATGGTDKVVRLWETATGRELRRFENQPAEVVLVVFLGNGRRLVAGSNDNTARLWDIETGKELRSFTGYSSPRDSVVAVSNERWLVTTGANNTAEVWDLETGRELRRLVGHSGPVSSVAFSRDEKYLATGSEDKSVRLWDLDSGRELRRFDGHLAAVTRVVFSDNGQYLATGSFEESATRLWDVQSGRSTYTLRTPGATSAIFSRDARYLLTTGSNVARLWDVQSGRELRHFENSSRLPIQPATFIGDGKRIVIGGGSGNAARLWDLESGKELRRFKASSSPLDPGLAKIWSFALSPDSRYLATGNLDGTAHILSLDRGTEQNLLKGHSGIITVVAFSLDGKYLMTGSADQTARLWEVESGKELRRFEGSFGGIGSLALSDDNRYLVTAATDGTTRIWDLGSGKELCRLISFNDGSWAVTDSEGRFDGSDDGNIEGLHWVVGTQSFSLNQFKARYYEPGLLNKILNRRPLRPIS